MRDNLMVEEKAQEERTAGWEVALGRRIQTNPNQV